MNDTGDHHTGGNRQSHKSVSHTFSYAKYGVREDMNPKRQLLGMCKDIGKGSLGGGVNMHI